MTIDFLEDILFSPNLLPAEHKIAGQLLRLLTMDETKKTLVDLNLLLIPSQVLCNLSELIVFQKKRLSLSDIYLCSWIHCIHHTSTKYAI